MMQDRIALLKEEFIMNTKEFIAKLEQDVKEGNLAIAEQIQAAGKNPEAVYAIAVEAGLTDSFEVFQAEMELQYETMSTELSDEELEAIAGGTDMIDKCCGAAGAILVGVLAAGA